MVRHTAVGVFQDPGVGENRSLRSVKSSSSVMCSGSASEAKYCKQSSPHRRVRATDLTHFNMREATQNSRSWSSLKMMTVDRSSRHSCRDRTVRITSDNVYHMTYRREKQNLIHIYWHISPLLLLNINPHHAHFKSAVFPNQIDIFDWPESMLFNSQAIRSAALR